MKFLHVSDIHLGKRLNNFPLDEDHEEILRQILDLARRDDVDAILIAGDVYNRAQPQPDAITLFSRFLTDLAALNKPVCIIRGNHDGEAQLAYAAPLLARQQLYISDLFDGTLSKVTLSDKYGPLNVWLLPFIKPIQARHCFPDDSISDYADAVRAVLRRAPIDPDQRNVLVTHQYVMGAQVSDSEVRSVGGLDQIPPEVFSAFDYVALGHLHKAQTLAHGKIRYCGAPLVYSFDECEQQKSATLVTLGRKGSPNSFEFIPFRPLHPCRRLEGLLDDLCRLPRTEDYVDIRLTDPIRPLDPTGSLKINFPNLLHLSLNHPDTHLGQEDFSDFEPTLDPLSHFVNFYTAQNGSQPSEEEIALVREMIEEAIRA